MIIYLCLILIHLINDYKNIYSRHNDVCLGVCMMVFMRIVSMRWFFMQIVRMRLFFMQVFSMRWLCMRIVSIKSVTWLFFYADC